MLGSLCKAAQGKWLIWDSQSAVWPPRPHTLTTVFLMAWKPCPLPTLPWSRRTVLAPLSLGTTSSAQREGPGLQKWLPRSGAHGARPTSVSRGRRGHGAEGRACPRAAVPSVFVQCGLFGLCDHDAFIFGELLFPAWHRRPLICQPRSFWFLWKCVVCQLRCCYLCFFSKISL